LIATACKDHRVRIFKLTENTSDSDTRYKVEMVANFVDHNAEVIYIYYRTIYMHRDNNGYDRFGE
jgi:hypothetical protein